MAQQPYFALDQDESHQMMSNDAETHERIVKLEAERDQAWRELRDIRAAIGADEQESTLDEVMRLRAAAGERDALREALQGMVDEFQHMARPGRAYISVDNALHAAGILDKANTALAVVPEPQADDRLAWAEHAARAMQEECYITIPSENGILRDAVHALDACAVARRAVGGE